MQTKIARDVFQQASFAPKIRPIPDGAADIARGLGLRPESTVWDFNWAQGIGKGKESDDHYAMDPTRACYESITLLSTGGATGVTLKLQPGFLDYQQEFAGVGNVIEVTDTLPKGRRYQKPEHSIPAQMLKKSMTSPALRHFFRGKTYCPTVPYAHEQQVAAQLGAATLIGGEEAAFFNSKVRVVREAARGDYSVAPFVVVEKDADLEAKMQKLMTKAQNLGLDPYHTKYWIKLDNYAGGEGVLPYEPARMDFSEVKEWINAARKDADMPDNLIFSPILMDIDIGHLPDVKRVLGNLCVQGIVGPEEAAITGTTFQRTKDGAYIGGMIAQTPHERFLASESQKWAYPVLEAAQRQGYRGYAGVDVIMTEDHTGNLRGYVLEMNARINMSTSLISMSQRAARAAGAESFPAMNISAAVPRMRDFTEFRRTFNSVFYQGAKSEHAGIVPLYVRPDEQGRLVGITTIAVAPDAPALEKVEKRFQSVLAKISNR